MPSLDPHSWSQADRDALDRHITGNWEGNFMYDPNDQDPPEEGTTHVYIAEDEEGWLRPVDAYSDETVSERPERLRHNLIELATANGWEVVDGPIVDDEDDTAQFDFYDEVL